MPSATTIRQIVEDLTNRTSTIASKFNECNNLCQTDAKYRSDIFRLVDGWDPATQSLPQELVDKLKLTHDEVAHIDEWPAQPEGKIDVRNAIRDAIGPARPTPRNMKFYWDLNPDVNATDSKSDIDPANLSGDGLITVTFLTPRSKVAKSGITYGEIKLGI